MGNIGSTFDIEQACRAKNETFDISDCLPRFLFNSTNHVVGVSSFGGIGPGEFKTEPDIAGIGVLLAFMVPSLIALGMGAILAIRPINDRILPERYQSEFTNRIAPAPPEHLRVEYEGPPSIFRRHQGTHRDNGSSHSAQNFLVNETSHSQSHYPAHPENYPLHHIPYHAKPFPAASSSVDVEDTDPVHPGPIDTEDDISEPDEKKPASETLYDMLQAALQAITDSQILLSLAFNASFRFHGKCEISLYHLRLALNITEVACANAFLSLLLIRNYWKAPLSALLRLIVLGLNIFMVFNILNTQQNFGYSAERMPPPERNSSLILLKASCFLDRDLADAVFANQTDSPFSNSTTRQFSTAVIANETTNSTSSISLTKDRYEAVGALDYSKNRPEWIIVRLLWTNLALTLVYAVLRRVRKYTRNGLSYFISYSYSFATWLFCLGVLCTNASYIFGLRRWVNGSGWFGTESENYVGLGQWAALTAMVGILFSFFDRLQVLGG